MMQIMQEERSLIRQAVFWSRPHAKTASLSSRKSVIMGV